MALELPTPPDSASWFVETHALASASMAPGSFTTLPPGATGGDQTSYQPQEYFGVEAGIGREFSGWGIPLRAILSGSLNFRHDTDVNALPAESPSYKANLQTTDLRLSLLADVLDLGWGRFYVGAGFGGARERTEVEIDGTPASTVNIQWKPSPSLEARFALTGLSRRVIPEFGYRFRWIGDVESATFPTGEKLRYKNMNIHDFMFGFTIPLAADASRFAPVAFTGSGPLASMLGSEAPWTGFYVGAFGGGARNQAFKVSELRTPAQVFYNPNNTYAIGDDGWIAGGEIGVDWQWRWLLLGLSGEIGQIGLDGAETDPNSPDGDTRTSFSTDWYGGVSARAGLAYRRLLVFGRVGVAYLNAEAKTVDDCTLAPCSASTARASEEDILFGWMGGAGLEYALTPHWSIGGEYRYFYVFDDLQPAGSASNLGSVAQNFGIDRIHTARASVKYRW